MIMTTFNPGSLVKLRNRDWIVLPSKDKDLLVIKPLGGTESEITGIYLPLEFKEEIPNSTVFPSPTENDLGSFSTAKLLYNSARLSFRNVAGPFRCVGKLSFRPRAYQLVPLIMALKQDPIRLLIADDVGIGKTIEALMITRELLDRGEIKRFAVVAPPHLCEQWQTELKDKFSIDAVVVRSSTAAQLDRKIQGDESIFKAYPYQVISIDFIKSGNKKNIFLSECPELVIVDEVHTCTKPAGASVSQQQRYHLVHDIAKKNQNLIMLTATPHSGKQPEFQSLLGLLKSEFETIDIVNTGYEKRKEIARQIVIRRRSDILKWHEETTFPKRDTQEVGYKLSQNYLNVFSELLKIARQLGASKEELNQRKKFQYFAILSLLRGVMSSPQAGIEMLSRKAMQFTVEKEETNDVDIINPVADENDIDSDALPLTVLEKAEFTSGVGKKLKEIAEKLEGIKDNKAEAALKITKDWLSEGFNPILFCRFIPTAKYLGEYFKGKLPKDAELLVITGEMVDEERKERINELAKSDNRKVLIATDCLSEGINLQEQFTAVLHYDLPWNPNRLEQREGRVDRFGQTAEEVKAYMLWGNDNPIDSVVLKVLLRKAREIKRQTGISVPFPDDSQGILDSLLNAVILNPNAVKEDQLTIDFGTTDIEENEIKVTRAYEQAARQNSATRSVFAQLSIKVDDIEQDLRNVDEAIGKPENVRDFVIESVHHLGAQINRYKKGYILYTTNLPNLFSKIFDGLDQVKISFESPTPDGFQYIGRNHPFVEQLCRIILNESVSEKIRKYSAARAAVVPTDKVDIKTTIIQLRIRNIIQDTRTSTELIAEELILWGYKGSLEENNFIDEETAKSLINDVVANADWSLQRRANVFNMEMEKLNGASGILSDIVYERSQKLVEAHERFRKAVGGKRYKIVEPVLPPDILGVYILMPNYI